MDNKDTCGPVAGHDFDGKIVKVGDRVDHFTHEDDRPGKMWTGGIVTKIGQEYKGEVACVVDYSGGPENGPMDWLNRLTRLRIAPIKTAPVVPEPEEIEQEFAFTVNGTPVSVSVLVTINPKS